MRKRHSHGIFAGVTNRIDMNSTTVTSVSVSPELKLAIRLAEKLDRNPAIRTALNLDKALHIDTNCVSDCNIIDDVPVNSNEVNYRPAVR